MATATATPNNLSKFTPGFTPECIALKYAEGKPVSSTYSGDQLMFTLADGRRWFADLYVGDKLAALGVQPGQAFEVFKVETRRGNQRTVQVEVEPMKPAGPAVTEPAVVAPVVNGEQPNQPNGSTPPAPLMNGNGETSKHQLTRYYFEAIDIALGAMAYAKEHGLLLTPAFEDIRCLAATMLINETGGRR